MCQEALRLPRLAPAKRDRNKERTRSAILDAALALFSRRGFHRTTTRQIARHAGIAEGTIFNDFRTKEDLALCFFERELAGLIDWYGQQAKLRRGPLPEKIFALVHRHLERMRPYEDFLGAVYLRALQPSSKLNPLSLDRQELNVRCLKFVRAVLEEAAEAGEIPPVGETVAYVVGIFHVAMITYWLHDRSRDKENTLALLDRSLQWAQTLLARRGGWTW